MSKDYNCQKWKIHIINDAENVYRIENQILFKDLTIKDNKLFLKKYNNSINQQFYLWKRQLNNKLIVEFPLKKLTKKLINRNPKISTVEIGYNIVHIDDSIKELFIKELCCEKKWLSKFKLKCLTKIYLKEGVKKINKNDFKDCINLLEIKLPKSLQFIEENSFENCLYAKKIIGDLKWYKYFNIEEINLKNETKIKREIFYNWTKLRKVILPNAIKEIEEGAFENCGIEEITIPNNVKYIPNNTML